MIKDERYPYTHSCDFIRSLAGYIKGSTKLSRSDASNIRQGIAFALNMEDKKLAELLANAEKLKTEEDHYKQAIECIKSMNS